MTKHPIRDRASKHLALLILILLLTSCQNSRTSIDKLEPIDLMNFSTFPEEKEDPFNYLYTAEIRNGEIIGTDVSELSPSVFSYGLLDTDFKEDRYQEQLPERIHPLLKERINNLSTQGIRETERIIINFRDDIQIPRFPQLDAQESPESESNRRVITRNEELIRQIQESRAADYERLSRELNRQYNAKVVQTFWLIKSIVVEMPLENVASLLTRQDVLYIQPELFISPPATVADGRALINSNWYFDLGRQYGYIALIDTGFRKSHTLLQHPSTPPLYHDHVHYDCFNGTDCQKVTNWRDPCNHGTSSAGIITGNNNLGNKYRGVTAIPLISLNMYSTSTCLGSTSAAVIAFERVIQYGGSIIVAEMQFRCGQSCNVSLTADRAFDAGKIVIAANGNHGDPGADNYPVASPANAHKVVGVGAYFISSGDTPSYQSRGPAEDGRIKPDIQAPTSTQTASSTNDTALRTFGGTSGSTPYAAGAAALVRNFLDYQGHGANDPGYTYAFLISSGQNTPPFNNTTGAGHLRLHGSYNFGGYNFVGWGKVSVGRGQIVNIPINLSSTGYKSVKAGLWWPESVSQSHNNIDLYLVDPNGVVRASSTEGPSVFERAQVNGSIISGSWTLRIRGTDVPTGSQTVYYVGGGAQ
jgi:hypothetical protein